MLENKTHHVSCRVTPSARRVIERAAEVAGKRLSAWVGDVALAEARRELQRELERLHKASQEGTLQ